MHKQYRRIRIFALLLGVTALVLAGWASADPPTRVARLGYTSGAVSFSPAGENDWVLATMNRPLITGDRLWVDAGARAELQVGSAVIRMSGSTSVTLLNLEDRVAQVQLAQGTLNVRVRRLDPKDVFEIDTPNLAYSIRRPGDYRVDVDPAGDATTVVVRNGQAEVYGDGGGVRRQCASRRTVLPGPDLRDYEYIEAAARPTTSTAGRPIAIAADSVSARYVSPDVIGYQDLDDYGSWRPPRATATCGCRIASRPAGRLTTTDIGHGSIRGAGPGWTTRRGASRCPTTAAGRTSAEPGAGSPVRFARGRSTRPPWSHSSAAAISRSRSLAAASRRRVVSARPPRRVPAVISGEPRATSTTSTPAIR